MTVSLSDLIAQKEALERQIDRARTTAKSEAISKVRQLMTEHGLTVSDLVAPAKTKGRVGARAGTKVEPKYRDPATGSAWTGGGLKPRWLAAALASGKTIDHFAV